MITDVNEINKIIREQLILQSGVSSNLVRNSLTTFGAELNKIISANVVDSIESSDCLILFELISRESGSDISQTITEEIYINKSYNLHIILYGASAQNIVNKLIARFRTEAVRVALIEQGIYIESVSNDTSINEYVNEVMWRRHDFDINLSCEILIEQVELPVDFETFEITVEED